MPCSNGGRWGGREIGVSEPGKWSPKWVHVPGPGRSHTSSSIRPLRVDEHVRIEDAIRIEGPLDGAEDVQLDRAAIEMEPRPLGPADPVLGADASAQLGNQVEDSVVDRVGRFVVVVADDVDMEVAVADVAEQVAMARRVDGRDRR